VIGTVRRLPLGASLNDERDRADADDEQLVVVARADPAAFAPLYDRHVDAVYRYCFHRLGNREAAENATSLTFTKALAALPGNRDGSFRAWLFAIAYNVVADHFRRSKPTVPLPREDDLPAGSPDPAQAVLAAHAERELHDLLRRLPEDQRRVMELRLSGLTSPEVATILGRSPVAVRSLQFRAVRRLRRALAPETQGKELPGAAR
jgi:RNA polymerase sigma-70 factor (ECF subfamily)